MHTISTHIIRTSTAAAVNILVGGCGEAARDAAWRALPNDPGLRTGDLPAVLSEWATTLQDGDVTVLPHKEPFEIVSIVSASAGIDDPLGRALVLARSEEADLAIWIEDQKLAYRCGLLTDYQIELLEALPGWTWD
jgi:hypothetical protein